MNRIVLFIMSVFITTSVLSLDLEDLINKSQSNFDSKKAEVTNQRMAATQDDITNLEFSKFKLPNFKYDFDADFQYGFGVTTIKDKVSTPPSLEERKSNLGTALDLERIRPKGTRIQNKISYQCKEEQKLAQDSIPDASIELSLDVFVNDIINDIGDMETDMKDQIKDYISSQFEVMSSYFSDTYIISKFIETYVGMQSKHTCNFCRTKNVLGCDGVFKIAEIYNEQMKAAAQKEMTKSKSTTTEKVKQKGNILEYTMGMGCTTESALRTTSGLGFGKGSNEFPIPGVKIKAYLSAKKGTIDDWAQEQCIEAETNATSSWIREMIQTAISKYTLKIEATNKCIEENSGKESILVKGIQVKKIKEREYMKSVNGGILKFAEKVNEMTGFDIFKDPEEVKDFVKAPDSDSGTEEMKDVLSKNSFNYESSETNYNKINTAIKRIRQQESSSTVKDIAINLVKRLYDFAQLKNIYKNKPGEMAELNQVITVQFDPENPHKKAKPKTSELNKLLEQQAIYQNDLNFYENEILNDLKSKSLNDSGVLICSDYGNITREEKHSCYYKSKLKGYGVAGVTVPSNCTCNNFDLITEIVPDTTNEIAKLISLLNSENLDDKPSANYEKYKKYLNEEKVNYLNNAMSLLVDISVVDIDRMAKLSHEEQKEIKRLFNIGLTELQ